MSHQYGVMQYSRKTYGVYTRSYTITLSDFLFTSDSIYQNYDTYTLFDNLRLDDWFTISINKADPWSTASNGTSSFTKRTSTVVNPWQN